MNAIFLEPRDSGTRVVGKRGDKLVINIDPDTSENISDELVQKAMDICPVGAIIRKGKGFEVPIGKRRYDHAPIGSEIEK